MAKISPRLLEETARTAGYAAVIHDTGVVNITDPAGRLRVTGYLNKSGRLELTSYELHRKMTTLGDLGVALDDLKEATR